MTTERSRYGLLMSSLGAVLLAGSLFLPWYRVKATATGAGSTGQVVTAEQALSALSVILLVLAGLALLDALVPLVRASSPVPAGAGGAVVLLGIVASGCVLYRMLAPPVPAGELVALSLQEGAWLSLLGALMVALGGMWPSRLPAMPGEAFGADIWASLTR